MIKKLRKSILIMALILVFIVAWIPENIYALSEVNKSDITSIKTISENETIYIGGPSELSKTRIITTILPENARQEVLYKSSNNKVLTINKDGSVQAKSKGNAIVEVKTKAKGLDGQHITQDVNVVVEEYVYPESISISCENREIYTGEKTFVTVGVQPINVTNNKYSFYSSNSEVATINEEGIVTANSEGKEGVVTIKTVASENDINGKVISATIDIVIKNKYEIGGIDKVEIHDPSIFKDPVSGKYYSYGSHIVAGVSDDAVSWNYISNSNLNYGKENTLFEQWYVEEFKDIYKWLFSYTDTDIEKIVSGEKKGPEGIWAIDVIYSDEAKKAGNDPYLMYVTVCNSAWKSAIVLCTSDNPESGFKYKETIVCSDYTIEEVDNGYTNLLDVLGFDTTAKVKEVYGEYYFPNGFRSSGAQVPDCIDPNPYYDQDGSLYISYGSFTCYGGIRVLKMDSTTGGRSSEKYDYSVNGKEVISDPYFGNKIANKYGEGPYVLTVKDTTGTSLTGYYYFLFYSQGNLNPYGGYNMRMMRSEYPDRGFVDYAGNSSLTTSINQTALGVRIMDNYKFSFMEYASTANGGNSAIVMDDGRIILHYHSKSNNGTFGFEVRNQQMFLNEDGWLVTTPHTYKGEKLIDISKEDIIGDYEFIYHRLSYTNTGSINNKYDYVDSVILTLNEDGTISGAYNGNWEYNKETNYISIVIDNKVYKGIVLKEFSDDSDYTKTISFGAIGTDNRTIWGSKVNKSNKEKAELDMNSISVQSVEKSNFNLSIKGFFGSKISWSSNNEAIIIDGSVAKVICQDYDTDVILTANIVNGEETLTKEFIVTVKGEEILIDTVVRTSYIYLPEFTAAGKKINWISSNENVISVDGTVVTPELASIVVILKAEIENSDKVLEFEVTVLPSEITSYLYTEDYEDVVEISSVWKSVNAQTSLTLDKDSQRGNFIKFATGEANSRGAESIFDLQDEIKGAYSIELDLSLTAGNNQETTFAITGKDYSYEGSNINNGLAEGYILKLSAIGSNIWTINNSMETVTIPVGKWIHVSAIVNTNTKKVIITISDENQIYYEGRVDISGSGLLNGAYIRGGRYQSITCIDNIKVY